MAGRLFHHLLNRSTASATMRALFSQSSFFAELSQPPLAVRAPSPALWDPRRAGLHSSKDTSPPPSHSAQPIDVIPSGLRGLCTKPKGDGTGEI